MPHHPFRANYSLLNVAVRALRILEHKNARTQEMKGTRDENEMKAMDAEVSPVVACVRVFSGLNSTAGTHHILYVWTRLYGGGYW